MEIIRDQTFDSESLGIDNKHFIDCSLRGCILEYAGGDVIFERTTLRGCRHVFYGQARSTLLYLQNVGLMPYEPAQWGEFSDQVH